ncbi:DUF5906 domain-containing protein [Marinobacterium lutimaris]|uniref:Putative DNA primase/helicase n=1 Tax=Marinobacterium lutimaris TaxID=568106 RepID=A0A1H5XVF2_9GAMM|nr:DUF5906 domain-containing protein [Marinobacterium lutimaris]SEG15370.1 putative DNA primase/helicase [Marinobacterium lutimaris]
MSLSDFNDLHVSQGLDAVRDQVMQAVERGARAANDEPPLPEEIPPEYESDDLPRSPSGQGGAKRRGMVVPALFDLKHHFALIYGTDTVFDGIQRKIMRLSHLKEAVGAERYKAWQSSEERVVVRNVVFDPSGRYDVNEYVNLYDGLPMQRGPATEEDVKPILNHIWWMASGDKTVYRWLIKWIAYPLQNPGAKMQSSIINYGAEGTGKSFLWEQVVKRMYGRYGITVGQAQLESTFTTWKSHKLFVVAEEVVSRAEKAHYKGQLKHMVTGDKHIINEKNLPEREEDNLMNFVFLSNNTQPLELDYGDRRYLALFMGQPKPKSYYQELGSWVEDGGVEAFYNWLVDLDLADFTPHDAPPSTEAKESLIDMSMPSPQYFYRQWASGDLPIPLGPVVNDDLYLAYQRWCEKSREYVMSHRKFSGELKRFLRQERVDIQHPMADTERRTKRVWVPDTWVPENPAERVRCIEKCCQAANQEVGRYHKGEVQ